MNTETHEKVVSMLKEGVKLAKIEGYLIYIEDFSVNQAKDLIAKTREELGFTTNTHSGVNWADTVEYLRENYGKLDKKDLINGMCEINGKTYATNQHAYNYIAMAQEWAKQEVEA